MMSYIGAAIALWIAANIVFVLLVGVSSRPAAIRTNRPNAR